MLTQYSKCGGCKALAIGKKSYICKLGVGIDFEKGFGVALAPKPQAKCHKPRTDESLKKLVDKNKK